MTEILKAQRRVDAGEPLNKPVRMPNGWLRVDARLTRTGVFEYRNPDGSPRRELRLPEEVFKTDSMASFGLVPVTDEHPPKYLDATNTKEHACGAMSETVRKDGDFLAGTMLITDAALIAKLESGEVEQVSCGYFADLEMTPGIYNGERYDAIQRGITGNHVAIVPRGKAGEGARVRMDGALSGVIRISTTQPEETPVKTIRIDGIDYEVGTDAAAQAFARWQERRDAAETTKAAELATAKAEIQKQAARADAALEKVAALEAELKAAPEKIRGEVRARMDLETTARSVLGSKAKFDGLDDTAVRAKVLAKLAPSAKLEGKDPVYVLARFDAEIEKFDPAAVDSAQAAVREALEGVQHDDAGDETEAPKPVGAEAAYEKMRAELRWAWKSNLKQS